MLASSQKSSAEQSVAMQQYYKFQSKIYDLTRWAFLFGRRSILQYIPFNRMDVFSILEVGCGTGHNLKIMANKFPNAHITGMDVSRDMYEIALTKMQPFGNRIKLQNRPYHFNDRTREGQVDIILFSYTLTMINPQWQDLLQRAYLDLKPGGRLLVVDFHDSKYPFFKTHMSHHHVRMDGHLLPVLREFNPVHQKVQSAYFGLWEYVEFVGGR